MDQEKIGQFIKEIRLNNKLTQKELADKLGVTFQAVSKWENGKNIPDIAILKRMCELYNMDINEILDAKKNPINKKRIIIFVMVCVVLIGSFIVLHNIFHKDDYEFKTITTTCDNFTIKGSAAYNKEKSNIYISNVEYCGKEPDENVYDEIKCNLYKDTKNYKTKISVCNEEKNTNLETYLKELTLNIEDSSKLCSNMNDLVLEITAYKSGVETKYEIPLKLESSC